MTIFLQTLKALLDCLFPAIGQMSGGITTVSGRLYSEVVGGDDKKELIVLTVKMI